MRPLFFRFSPPGSRGNLSLYQHLGWWLGSWSGKPRSADPGNISAAVRDRPALIVGSELPEK
jgi:hypothetical protein